jgi:hypothetical protein
LRSNTHARYIFCVYGKLVLTCFSLNYVRFSAAPQSRMRICAHLTASAVQLATLRLRFCPVFGFRAVVTV